MFKSTLTVTRPNTSILWSDPQEEEDIYRILTEAAKRNITAVQLFSPDLLTMNLIWSAPSEEIWNEFSHNFLRKNGEIDDSWYNSNEMTYKITKENIDE